MLISKKKLRILHFDCESRPLSFWIPDGPPTAEITAIASCWADDLGSMTVHLLGRDEPKNMFQFFQERYAEADLVTGHYVRKFDLPLLNAMLMEAGLPQLSAKLVSDTKEDMRKKSSLPATQEYLSELFGIPAPKIQMSQHTWRNANRLNDPNWIQRTEQRVSGDVIQHMLLRSEMIKRDLLKTPRLWRP